VLDGIRGNGGHDHVTAVAESPEVANVSALESLELPRIGRARIRQGNAKNEVFCAHIFRSR
jgi:hypothetical protein